MGRESRRNPVAIAAKNGELPPKKRPLSKKERDALITAMLHERLGLTKIYDAMKMR